MRVELDHITKVFGTVRANDDISMTLESRHIYVLLSAIGAGKSTLMQILSGYQSPDSGNIVLDDKLVSFATPADALRVGIGMLHQDVLDVPNMTVLENFILGRNEGLLPDYAEAKSALTEGAAKLAFTLQPDAYVDSLTIGERQQLEIVRLLDRGARVLILDEPTTGISTDQKDALFNSLRTLATNDSITVILVSHKLEDVEALCDDVYVLRQGKVVVEVAAPFSTDMLIELMFGKEIKRTPRLTVTDQGQPVILRVRELSVHGRRVTVRDVSLDVYAGEVIGLAGLDGSGQQSFLRAGAGLVKPDGGSIYLENRDITHLSYHHRVKLGFAYAPAGRLEEGLITGLTLAEHFALSSPSGLWIDWQGARQRADQSIARYNIRGRPESIIQTLSGGNQQRALLALLPSNLKLLLMESPTRGLDVESARWVWQQLLERRQHGTAIIFLSPDLDEIMEYSDRIMVFFGGHTTLLDDPSTITLAELGRLIGGK